MCQLELLSPNKDPTWVHNRHTIVVHGQEHDEICHSKLNHMDQGSDKLSLDHSPSAW